MKTPLFILLQATGGIRNEVNTFLSDYAVPVIAMLLIVGVGIGVVMNYDKIIDRDGQGTRKEGIVNLRLSGNFWLVSFKISYLCLPLFHETRTTPSCHPSGCAYRQL